mmetsp:Transcript_506/g.808  ORF Transcript_506/g.808 Transcript_506/m.808 type:complete len:151 (+) Transcript_506:599-1051(+)
MMEPSSLSFGSNLWDVLKVLGVLLRHLCARVCPLLFRLSLGRLLPLNLRNLCSGRTTRRKLGFLLCRLACRLLLHHLRITLGTLRGRQVLLVALVLFILILDVFLLRELTGKSTGHEGFSRRTQRMLLSSDACPFVREDGGGKERKEGGK